MVGIEVGIAEGVDETARLEAGHLRHHQGEEGVGGDVERHTEEHVGTALVQLARQLAVADVELEHHVARRQRHLLNLAHIPRTDDEPARVGIFLYIIEYLRNLVNGGVVSAGPRTPLLAVNGTEVAVRVGPFVPNRHLMVVQVGNVGVALQEPQQFIDDGTEVQLLGCQQGKTLLQVEAHLVPENADRAGTGTVGLLMSLCQNSL